MEWGKTRGVQGTLQSYWSTLTASLLFDLMTKIQQTTTTKKGRARTEAAHLPAVMSIIHEVWLCVLAPRLLMLPLLWLLLLLLVMARTGMTLVSPSVGTSLFNRSRHHCRCCLMLSACHGCPRDEPRWPIILLSALAHCTKNRCLLRNIVKILMKGLEVPSGKLLGQPTKGGF